MDEAIVTSTEPTGPSTPSEPVQFLWKGRPLSRQEVGNVYFLLSAAILAVGILVNWVLTDGYWYIPGTGANQQYLHSHPYDIASGFILIVSLVLLGVGFLNRSRSRHHQRALGFVIFGFYWATQAMKLYASENGDFVNAIFAMFAVFFFNYFAYHELVSFKRDEDPRALQWLAGTAFITTGVYFLTHKIQPIAHFLIEAVAGETQWLLQAFGQGTILCENAYGERSMIFYPELPEAGCASSGYFTVQIILACTAIQSIMIFVGGILALKPPRLGDGVSGKANKFEKLESTYGRRRLWGFLLTVPLIYVLNLFRNVIIIWMSGQPEPVLFDDPDSAFWFSHNVIGKGGSLVALVIIAFIVFQILPELYDSIIGLLDLKDRRGPLETWLGQKFGRRPGGGKMKEQSAPPPTTNTPPAAAPSEAPLE